MEKDEFTLQIEERPHYLYVQTSGIRSRDTVKAITAQVFTCALEKHFSKILIDVRELNGLFGVKDIYFLVTDLLRDLRGKGVDQVAIIDVRRSMYTGWVLEPVAQSRGFNFRVFAEYDSAVKWLNV
jgi:hypothetical protein